MLLMEVDSVFALMKCTGVIGMMVATVGKYRHCIYLLCLTLSVWRVSSIVTLLITTLERPPLFSNNWKIVHLGKQYPVFLWRITWCISIGPDIRQDYPLNLSILISGGKEINWDCLSSGERTGKSPSWKSPAYGWRVVSSRYGSVRGLDA